MKSELNLNTNLLFLCIYGNNQSLALVHFYNLLRLFTSCKIKIVFWFYFDILFFVHERLTADRTWKGLIFSLFYQITSNMFRTTWSVFIKLFKTHNFKRFYILLLGLPHRVKIYACLITLEICEVHTLNLV